MFGQEAERGPEVRPTKIVSRWGAFEGNPAGVVEVMDGLLVFEK